jgi:hypothetical protein
MLNVTEEPSKTVPKPSPESKEMLLMDLILILQALYSEHGDLPVYVEDESGYNLVPSPAFEGPASIYGDEFPARIVI